jgi:4-oxalocrotonate tautomerase
MPLARIEIPIGKPADFGRDVADTVQQALHEALGVPMEERFQIVTEHPPAGLIIDPSYLGIVRSPEAVIIQIFLNAGRDAPKKRLFFRALADALGERVGLRREDVVVSLVEVQQDDWSFGDGEAQLA